MARRSGLSSTIGIPGSAAYLIFYLLAMIRLPFAIILGVLHHLWFVAYGQWRYTGLVTTTVALGTSPASSAPRHFLCKERTRRLIWRGRLPFVVVLP